MKPNHAILFCATAMALSMAGCSVGPDYVRSAPPLPASYPLAGGGEVKIDSAWWAQFNDPVLDQLVAAALKNNGDIAVSVARVAEAEAFSREVTGAFFPQIDLELVGRNTKNSTKSSAANNGSANLHPHARTAALTTAYEIDVWGRSRRASESARAKLLASQYGRDAMSVSVAAIVAQQYIGLRALDAQLDLVSALRAGQTSSRDIVQTRVDAGLAPRLDALRAQSALSALDAQLAGLREQRGLRESQLGLLTGNPGLVIAPGGLAGMPMPVAPPAGLPSDLIENRPDVRQAEQALIAANAGVGLAKAAYFPRITLTGRLGFESQDLADLFAAGATTGAGGLALALPLLDFGKTSAQLEQARARNAQTFAQYQQTVQAAFKDVRDAFQALRERSLADTLQQSRTDDAQLALDLARQRYQAGYSGYLDVLDAERSLQEASLAKVDARRARLSAAVDVFKALGGGWKAQ